MSNLRWEDCDLYKCLGALELHNRIVAMGLDGSTCDGDTQPCGSNQPEDSNSATASDFNDDSNRSNHAAPSKSRSTSPATNDKDKQKTAHNEKDNSSKNSNRLTLPPQASSVNYRLSRLLGGGIGGSKKRPQSVAVDSIPKIDDQNKEKDKNKERATTSQEPAPRDPAADPAFSNSQKDGSYEVMKQIRKSLFDSPALATVASHTMYYKYFLRSVLWRIYLRLLPFPYTGTARETIVEDWPTILFRCRAWYGGQRQQFLHCYPVHTYVAEECAEYEPQNNLRTFTHFAEKAASASPSSPYDGPSTENGGFFASGVDAGGDSSSRKSTSLASTLRNTLRGSVMMSNGVPSSSAGFSQSYTNGSCLDGGPQAIREDIITMDIKRTYVSADHDVPHHTLFMILAMWRWQNPLVGYQQGMHEIAGNILLMLKRACEGVPRGTPPEVAQCANLAYVEADTYMIFDAFMNELGLAELFAASSAANQQNATGRGGGGGKSNASSPRGNAGGGSSIHSARSDRRSHNSFEGGDDDANSSPLPSELTTLEAVCHHIVFDLLKDHSLSLFNHFANTNVLDQLLLFLPRWIRNMFTREMTRPQVLAVWDGILSVYYADVVASAISEQERDAARKAALQKQKSSSSSVASSASRSMFSALRQSIRFGGGGPSSPMRDKKKGGKASSNLSDEADTTSSQFTHFISASDGNRTLGSFSPPITDMAYVGEKGSFAARTRRVKVGGEEGSGRGDTNNGDEEENDEEEALNTSHSSTAISISTFGGGSTSMSTRRGIGRRVGGFLRTVAGVAVELLLYLEEDLLALPDDFSQLKRLTRTPLLPSTADAMGILLRATTIARTRPRGLVLRTINGQASISATSASPTTTISNLSGKSSKKSSNTPLLYGHHAAQNSRLTREELLEQQKSVALVIANAANRLRAIMAQHAPPGSGHQSAEKSQEDPVDGDYSSISHKDKDMIGKERKPAKSFTISPENVAQLQGVLLELEHLTDKLI